MSNDDLRAYVSTALDIDIPRKVLKRVEDVIFNNLLLDSFSQNDFELCCAIDTEVMFAFLRKCSSDPKFHYRVKHKLFKRIREENKACELFD